MKTNKEITIPTTQNEITLKQYQDIQIFMDSETDDMKIGVKMITTLCDITEEEVRGISKADFDSIIETLLQTLNKKSVWQQRFKIGNVTYGFIPNIDDMTLGEYIDLDNVINEPHALHKVMTILYRPITHESFGRYDIAKYTGKEDTEIMLQAPLDAVNGAFVFFYHLGNALLKAMPHYLQKVQKEIIASNQLSAKDGDGIVRSMELQMETLTSLIEQLNIVFIKP